MTIIVVGNNNVLVGGVSLKPKISLNPDTEVVNNIKEGLKARNGYCPCRIEQIEDNKCMCKEFRDQIADPDYEGFCHCMLYYKSYEKESE